MANRFWNTNTSGALWSNTANWSEVSDGPGGFSVPVEGDNATISREITATTTIGGINGATLPDIISIADTPIVSNSYVFGSTSDSTNVSASDVMFIMTGAASAPTLWNARFNGAGQVVRKRGTGWLRLVTPTTASTLQAVEVWEGPFGIQAAFGGTLYIGVDGYTPASTLIFDVQQPSVAVSCPVIARRSFTIQNSNASAKTYSFSQPFVIEAASGVSPVTLTVSLNTSCAFTGGLVLKSNFTSNISTGSFWSAAGGVTFDAPLTFTTFGSSTGFTVAGPLAFNHNASFAIATSSSAFSGAVNFGDARTLTFNSGNSLFFSGTATGTNGLTLNSYSRSRGIGLSGNSSGISGPCTINAGLVTIENNLKWLPTAVNVVSETLSRFAYRVQTADFNFPASLTGPGQVVIGGAFAGTGCTFPASGPGNIEGWAGQLFAISNTITNHNTPKIVIHHLPKTLGFAILTSFAGPSQASDIQYVGAGETRDTNVVVDTEVNSQNALLASSTYTLQANGTGPIVLTGSTTRTNSGTNASGQVTLTLSGANEGANTLAGSVSEVGTNSATLAIRKSGTGRWVLSGVLTYTGPTTVAQGTLRIAAVNSNSTSGATTVDAGSTLELATDTPPGSNSSAGKVLGTSNVTCNGTIKTRGGLIQKGQVRYHADLSFGSGASLYIGAAA